MSQSDYEYFSWLSECRKENPIFCEWCKYEVQNWVSHKKSKHHLVQSFQIKPTKEDNKEVFCFPCAKYLDPDRENVKKHSETKGHLVWCERTNTDSKRVLKVTPVDSCKWCYRT